MFYVFSADILQTLPFNQLFGSMLHGVRMDLSMSAYYTAPVLLMVLISTVLKASWDRIISFYTVFLLAMTIIGCMVDLGSYHAWGIRLDGGSLKYLRNMKEAWASVSHFPWVWIGIGLVLMLTALYFLYGVLRKHIAQFFLNTGFRVWVVLSILLFGGISVLAMRGGTQLAPMNQSMVYWSNTHSANLLAINGMWNFMYTWLRQRHEDRNPYEYLPKIEATQHLAELYQDTSMGNWLRSDVKKPNIVIIIWESFTAKVVSKTVSGIEVVPGFMRLMKEGIYFSNCYASGDRTDKGLVAVLSGYPAQPTVSIVKNPRKAALLPTLSEFLNQQGYFTSFVYGGEMEFANMKAYLSEAGFQSLVDKQYFPSDAMNSKWGAWDGVAMKRVLDIQDTLKAPFLSTWLTLTSHEPFETPIPTVIAGSDETAMFLNALNYTDGVVYDFVQRCKTKAYWDNTVCFIVADHGHRMPASSHKIEDYRIPLLMIGGALKTKGIKVDRVVSQLDIADYIARIVGDRQDAFPWSKPLSDQGMGWAQFAFNDGFGFVKEGRYVIFDNVGRNVIESNDTLVNDLIQNGQSFEQLSYQDYLEK